MFLDMLDRVKYSIKVNGVKTFEPFRSRIFAVSLWWKGVRR